MDCGDPGTPANGLRVGDEFTVGSIVRYVCDAGFGLDGPADRECQVDGTWSGFLPTCVEEGKWPRLQWMSVRTFACVTIPLLLSVSMYT